MRITFFGAAGGVTGSKHLLEIEGFKLLLDCGLHQGKRQEANQLNRSLPFEAKDINAVILSHAHADHCGTLPVLVKNGYLGKIYSTSATADVAGYILQDSAKIQEQDTNYINDHMKAGQEPIYPLYTQEDVEATLKHFEPVSYFHESKQWTKLSEKVRFKLYDAGHILGSSVVVVEYEENGITKRLGFSGDLGPGHVPMLQEPEIPTDEIENFILECTYGNRLHKPLPDAVNELKNVINEATSAGRKIIVPAFSLGRTQELIYLLHKLTDQNAIPKIPIYIDSPLATNLAEIFDKYREDFNRDAWNDFGTKGEVPLEFPNLQYTHSIEESKQLNSQPGPFIVISASGMCEGGRILHHLKHNLPDPNALVLITGYQAEDTLGRKILEGESRVKIFGEPVEVKAKILVFNEFSAHADQSGLLKFAEAMHGLKKVFLVHTETPQATAFTELLNKDLPEVKVIRPNLGDSFEI